MAKDRNNHKVVHFCDICRQVIDTGQETVHSLDPISVNNLPCLEGLPGDAERVRVDLLASPAELALSVSHSVLRGQCLIELLPLQLTFTLRLILLNREQLVRLVVPEKDADPIEAKELRQDLAAVHDVVYITTLGADSARSFERLNYLPLSDALQLECLYVMQLGLEHGCNQRKELLIKVGEALLMTSFLVRNELYRKNSFTICVENWMSQVFLIANSALRFLLVFKHRIG